MRRAAFAASRERSDISIRTFSANALFMESRSSMKSANITSPVGRMKLTWPEAVTVSVR